MIVDQIVVVVRVSGAMVCCQEPAGPLQLTKWLDGKGRAVAVGLSSWSMSNWLSVVRVQVQAWAGTHVS